ncbi:hypothetical protein KVR01_008110 [Diaporthe batatas]|uniref:uncharacterized protein n=1 Tax=Diaporthe batatas TaxID=748121 RepID=UPI001D03E5A0|nr:uncharacterized protein KVR01_008110 [Diaporthe batatas]KAG8162345.1 hypothetical protein KVR01_008110 [Diaporthe batatas]
MEYESRFWRVDFATRRAFVKEMVRANADLELRNKYLFSGSFESLADAKGTGGSTPLLMAAALDARMTPVLLEFGSKVHSRGTLITINNGVEDVNMLHVLAQHPHGRIPSKLTSLLGHFLGVDPDRSSSATMCASPLNILRNTLDNNPAWGIADVLAFTELIIGIRETNWGAGLFLESQRTFREDGSHERIKLWVNAVSRLMTKNAQSDCGCLRRGSQWMMWWDEWTMDDCCITCIKRSSTPSQESRFGEDGIGEIEDISDQDGAETFYDAVDYR